ENGVVVDVVDGVANVVGAVEVHNVYVDGSSVGEVTDTELKDRRILAEEGFVSVFAVIDSANGKVLSGPEVHARGLAEDDSVFEAILPEIKNAPEEAAKAGGVDNHHMQQVMRRVVGRLVGTQLRRPPMFIPTVIEASGPQRPRSRPPACASPRVRTASSKARSDHFWLLAGICGRRAPEAIPDSCGTSCSRSTTRIRSLTQRLRRCSLASERER